MSAAVTLHVSVWVEMAEDVANPRPPRHAPRERVSWNSASVTIVEKFYVTLHVSVWVEIFNRERSDHLAWRHAPRERVSWNVLRLLSMQLSPGSRSTWACELKSSPLSGSWLSAPVTLHVSVWVEMDCADKWERVRTGHAPRERVSWNVNWFVCSVFHTGHAPRERVSWNSYFFQFFFPFR